MDIEEHKAMVGMVTDAATKALSGENEDVEDKLAAEKTAVALIGLTLICEFGADIKRVADALEAQNRLTRIALGLEQRP